MSLPLKASFSRGMGQDSIENCELLYNLEQNDICSLLNHDLATLKKLKSSLTSYQINRLDHSLQIKKCAEPDGAGIEIIVDVLNHNIGDAPAPEDHSRVPATIIRPFSQDEMT